MRKTVVAAVVAVAGCTAIAALWCRRSTRRWRRADRIVRELKARCATPLSKLWAVADDMAQQMRDGLATEGGSSLRMLPTPLKSLPNGTENGLFYGLDLRQTKLRLLRVQLRGRDANVIRRQLAEVPVPSYLMIGTSKELYNYIAAELSKFITSDGDVSNVPRGRHNEIGFTVSFPVVHNSASCESIIEWSKGFSIKEMERRDAVAGMNEAMDKHGIELHVSSLVNDTIGTLAGGKFYSSDTVAAVILGMGINAAYVELAHAIPKWHSAYPDQEELVINMEWGNFQSPHVPVTEFDSDLDAESPNPGKQKFEKLVSGKHLGDIVRRVLLKIAEETALFGDCVPPKLRIPYILRTPDVASMHQDRSPDLAVVGEKLEESLGIPDTTLRMRKTVVEVCDTVTRRGACLAAAGIMGILKKLGRERTDEKSLVVVEGGLYEHYRLFRNYLNGAFTEMLQGKHSPNVVVQQLHEGCRIGPALLAAMGSQQARSQ